MLASRILDVGKSFLGSTNQDSGSKEDTSNNDADVAVEWLKKALYLTERVERGDGSRGIGISQLKVSWSWRDYDILC